MKEGIKLIGNNNEDDDDGRNAPRCFPFPDPVHDFASHAIPYVWLVRLFFSCVRIVVV